MYLYLLVQHYTNCTLPEPLIADILTSVVQLTGNYPFPTVGDMQAIIVLLIMKLHFNQFQVCFTRRNTVELPDKAQYWFCLNYRNFKDTNKDETTTTVVLGHSQ